MSRLHLKIDMPYFMYKNVICECIDFLKKTTLVTRWGGTWIFFFLNVTKCWEKLFLLFLSVYLNKDACISYFESVSCCIVQTHVIAIVFE